MTDQLVIREATIHSPANEGVPTQVANPARTVLRTIVQALIALVPILNAVALVLAAYLGEQTEVVVPPVVFAILNGVIAVTALLIGLVTRIFAVPGVEAWLRKWAPGLAALRP
jgi:hypothetical protein